MDRSPDLLNPKIQTEWSSTIIDASINRGIPSTWLVLLRVQLELRAKIAKFRAGSARSFSASAHCRDAEPLRLKAERRVNGLVTSRFALASIVTRTQTLTPSTGPKHKSTSKPHHMFVCGTSHATPIMGPRPHPTLHRSEKASFPREIRGNGSWGVFFYN